MNTPKPTDSEQPSDAFLEMANDAKLTVGQVKQVLAWHKKEVQQQLSAALEALKALKLAPDNVNPQPLEAYERGMNMGIDYSTTVLTAALGLDNSKIEE